MMFTSNEAMFTPNEAMFTSNKAMFTSNEVLFTSFTVYIITCNINMHTYIYKKISYRKWKHPAYSSLKL